MTQSKLPPLICLSASIFAAAALASGAACAGPSAVSQADTAWARSALDHRRALEIVAADPQTGLITVRVAQAQPPAPTGRVLLSGPGYRIATAGPASAGGIPASSNDTAGAQLMSGIPLERRDQPIVCQGPRLLHIDSRNLEFRGDAVRAEDGCEVHITNSRIVAKGFAVVAHDASVHIDNSSLSGGEGAVSASGGSQVYARSSTFQGSIRRLDSASFHDLGGNAGN
jgi:hypothetical protein